MVMQNICFITTNNSQYVNNRQHANKQLVGIGRYTKVLPKLLLLQTLLLPYRLFLLYN